MKDKPIPNSSEKSRAKRPVHPSAKLVRPPGEPTAEQSLSPHAANPHPPASAPCPGLAVDNALVSDSINAPIANQAGQEGADVAENLAQNMARDFVQNLHNSCAAQKAASKNPKKVRKSKPSTGAAPKPAKPEAPAPAGSGGPPQANGAPGPWLASNILPVAQPFIHPKLDPFQNVDIVRVMGNFSPSSYQAMLINGTLLITLTPKEFIVVMLLLWHSHSRAGMHARYDLGEHMYLSTKRIIAMIEKLMPTMGEQRTTYAWKPRNIHRLISDLRARIGLKGGNRNIIQPARRAGYRFSVPPTYISHQEK
jgi:hypothetical protein